MSLVTITPVVGTDLHCTYSGQLHPQPCHVQLDMRSGALTAATDPEIGNAVPSAVWHGHVVRWNIEPLRADCANALLEDLASLAARMVAGYSSRWNGSNHVASLTDDAREAHDAIERLCDQAGHDDAARLHVWAAADWFAPLGTHSRCAAALGILAETTDEELDAIAERETRDAESTTECDRLEGCEEFLRDVRATLRDAEVGT